MKKEGKKDKEEREGERKRERDTKREYLSADELLPQTDTPAKAGAH